MGEFEIIARYFRPLTNGDALQDDAAVIAIPDGYELVVSSDTLNAGTHFLADESPENIAHKALRVNLSDLAAMGARPLCYQLNLAFPKPPDDMWLGAFTGALLADQKTYGIYCSGGDTTGILGDYLSLSITVMGLVPAGRALRRSGARAGDVIILTGAVGDAVLGLKSLQGNLPYINAIKRYQKPLPRFEVCHMQGDIHAAVDISDGFLADVSHIAKASGLCAQVTLSSLIYSDEVTRAIAAGHITEIQALTGGDDYELALAVPPEKADKVMAEFLRFGLRPMLAGEFTQGQDLRVLDSQNQEIDIAQTGWQHF